MIHTCSVAILLAQHYNVLQARPGGLCRAPVRAYTRWHEQPHKAQHAPAHAHQRMRRLPQRRRACRWPACRACALPGPRAGPLHVACSGTPHPASPGLLHPPQRARPAVGRAQGARRARLHARALARRSPDLNKQGVWPSPSPSPWLHVRRPPQPRPRRRPHRTFVKFVELWSPCEHTGRRAQLAAGGSRARRGAGWCTHLGCGASWGQSML
jgi:hypothetical protein